MAQYRPSGPFNVPMMLLTPEYTESYGVPKKSFPNIADGILIYGSFKSYGGTERDVNGIYSIEDTANVETWYRPDITSDCRIVVLQNCAVYEIWSEPENINMMNQYLKFKVKRYMGGA